MTQILVTLTRPVNTGKTGLFLCQKQQEESRRICRFELVSYLKLARTGKSKRLCVCFSSMVQQVIELHGYRTIPFNLWGKASHSLTSQTDRALHVKAQRNSTLKMHLRCCEKQEEPRIQMNKMSKRLDKKDRYLETFQKEHFSEIV